MIPRRWLIAACSVMVVVVVVLGCRKPAITFSSLAQAQDRITESGYWCTSDCADGRLEFGFMVTREPADWATIAPMRKIGKLGPDWRGKVWIMKIGDQISLATTPDTDDVRVWGTVVAYGDREVLDELERMLRRANS